MESMGWFLLGLSLLAFYYLITYNQKFFLNRNTPFAKPYPFFGNILNIFFRRESFPDLFRRHYNMFPNSRFFGLFELMTPVYVLRDPELVKQITIKDYDHFLNHRQQMDENIEPIFSRNLFTIKNQKWREMRSILSPAFTGSKMRLMFDLIGECSDKTVKLLKGRMVNNAVELEMKDFFSRFSSDVIATSAFGLQINSHDRDDHEFYVMGKKISNFSGLQGLKFFGYSSCPTLMKFFKIQLFEDHVVKFFRDLVTTTINEREKNHIVRTDMINLLMQAKKGGISNQDFDAKYDDAGFATVTENKMKKVSDPKYTEKIKWEADDLTAQCLIFFLAGFDTASQLMCFTGHELAVNPDIQERLRREVDDVNEKLNGQPLTYETLQSMKYLDMVISESLRKWPPAVAIDRMCNIPYVLENWDGTKVQLNVNDGIWIPVYAFHHDPKYFPNPGLFDPERFSDENKHKINPLTYLPFGMGPRNCIGSRFALMEAKAIIFHLMSSFYLEKSPKTQHPIKLMKKSFNMLPEKGFWLQLRARN